MDVGGTVGAWASLPLDLLLEIFRRLESTAVIRCAGTCRLWRQAIIGNTSIERCSRTCCRHVTASSYSKQGHGVVMSVCCATQCMTGACKILPDATIRSCTYVLLTGYDDLSVSGTKIADHDLQAVRILAVAGTADTMSTEENRITYQVFSFASGQGEDTGAWGPVKRSVDLKRAIRVPVYDPGTVVSGGAVYWLGGAKDRLPEITCAVALDVRTGWAWITELAEGTKIVGANISTPTLLGTSGKGRLSLIRSPYPTWTGHGQQIEVWELMGDDQWCLKKTIDVQVHKLLPDYRHEYFKYKPVRLNAFCPRSGSVIGAFAGQDIRIVLEGSSDTCPELIRRREGFYCDKYNTWIITTRDEGFDCSNAYEMDWSTYISMMKVF